MRGRNRVRFRRCSVASVIRRSKLRARQTAIAMMIPVENNNHSRIMSGGNACVNAIWDDMFSSGVSKNGFENIIAAANTHTNTVMDI